MYIIRSLHHATPTFIGRSDEGVYQLTTLSACVFNTVSEARAAGFKFAYDRVESPYGYVINSIATEGHFEIVSSQPQELNNEEVQS